MLKNKFVSFDDNTYITENPALAAGVSASGLRWAFTTFYAGNWHPLTWISHEIDVSLFGMNPTGHHLVNLGLHLANTLLLFALLHAATGVVLPSALVAALLAVHPLHVESVAWASERKDVLAALFCLLSMRSYLSWLRTNRSSRLYSSLAAFIAGTMAKPMIVTLPLLLLVLDYWPLGRVPRGTSSCRRAGTLKLLVEKIPFLAVAGASSAVTVIAQSRGEMMYSLPLSWRLSNAVNSVPSYLAKTMWPHDLTAFYPHPEGTLDLTTVLSAAVVLSIVSGVVVVLMVRRPWLFTGWVWFLTCLAPVLGIIQVGNQGYADRYAYLALAGTSLIIAWEVQAVASHRAVRVAAGAAALTSVLVFAPLTRQQVGYWRDDATFFTHMMAATQGNWIAVNGVGLVLAQQRDYEKAAKYFEESVNIRPDFWMGWANLGNALVGMKRPEGVAALERAISIKPDYVPPYTSLAWYYLGVGDLRGA
ncbi:MAG TPA: hypothetical protein VI078_16410, partial [bacterium]